MFNNRTGETVDPLAIGIEFGTAGHVFQLVVSSTPNIREQNIYTRQNIDYKNGDFVLGFNITRVWWLKKYLINPKRL